MAARRGALLVSHYLASLRSRAFLCSTRRCRLATSSLVARENRNGGDESATSASVPKPGGFEDSGDARLGGFAKAFQKYTDPEFLDPAMAVRKQEASEPPASFAALLRNCKFVQAGDPEGAVVVGEIYHVAGDDLYVELGWKFPCVVKRPARNPEAFVRGAKVRLRVNDLELSTRFLGSPRDLTLCEADCTLLGLTSTPVTTAAVAAK